MFDRRLLFTGAALLIVTAASLVLSSAPEIPEIAPIDENVTDAAQTVPNEKRSAKRPDEAENYKYTIKEHNGHVAVFPAKSDEPELILDVLVKYLPDLDRTQMQEGIQVRDYEELVRLIEDYTS